MVSRGVEVQTSPSQDPSPEFARLERMSNLEHGYRGESVDIFRSSLVYMGGEKEWMGFYIPKRFLETNG